MTVAQPSENEVVSLRKQAQEMASSRRESLTTAHLLAAIASRQGPATDLLLDRRLDVETLSRLARASSDDEQDPIGHAMRRASEVARAASAREPASIHLLVALLSQRKSAAFRALEQSGVDVARLRSAAIRAAGGLLEPRRQVSRHATDMTALSGPGVAPSPSRRRISTLPPATGVVVPLVPPAPGAAPPSRPGRTLASPNGPRSEPPPAPTAEPLPAEAVETAPKARPSTRRKITAQDRRASRFELDAKAFPTLTTLGVNLSLAAVRSELEPVIGRQVEIEQSLDVLAKRRANNPCLIGPSGVGKTSIVRGLAYRIVNEEDVRCLDDRIIVELPVPQLIAGTGVRGALSERLAAICKEVKEASGRVVLFIDDLPQLFAADGGGEASTEIKMALARGELPLVSTASVEDYRRNVEADPSLARCFTVIEVQEPTEQQAVDMLSGASSILEKHHGMPIDAAAVKASVTWSVRYLPGRALPEKALSILDLAGARCRRRARTKVDQEAVAEVISEMADMPIERLLETDRDRMLSLEKLLSDRVVGHSQALGRIATILRRNAAGFRAHRPIGSFLLLGPTGVGKTETAKAIAQALFHSADAMTRLDFSEFAEPHSMARLIGAPPGYVGHEQGGQLTESVKRRPYQVLLLDEFEKAHRDVHQAFLQVLDEGRMTDGRGRTVDFTNTVVVLTSNLGAAEAKQATQSRPIGFSREEAGVQKALEQVMLQAARSTLPPELYNRIDEVLVYAALSREDVREVARRLLSGLAQQLRQSRGIGLVVDPSAIEALLDQGGYDPTLGARPMKRAIARLIEAPLAEMILREQFDPEDRLLVRADPRGVLDLKRVPASLMH